MRRLLSSLLIVARREMREWRLVWLAAVLLGTLAFLSPWLPSMNRYSPAEVRGPVTLAVLLLLSVTLVLFMGVRLANQDLVEGRFAFYFTLPIPSTALWLGRLAGMMMVILVAGLLVVTPTWVVHQPMLDSGRGQSLATPWTARAEAAWSHSFGHAFLPQSWGLAGILAKFLVGTLTSLLAIHAIATFARSRNVWLVLDILALFTVVALASWAVDQLISEQALGPLVWTERALGVWLAGALLVAGGVQIAQGRSDGEKGRRLLSTVFWPLLLIGTLGCVAFAGWVTDVEVDDLVSRSPSLVRPSPGDASSGEWLFLGGPTHFRDGYRAAFLLEHRSGRSLRLGALDTARISMRVAAEAGVLIWARCTRLSLNQDCELWTLNLERPQPQPRPTGIPVAPDQRTIVLSPNGTLVASERHSFYEVETGRLVWSSTEVFTAAVFQPMDRVLLYRPTEGRVDILELDLSRRVEVGPAGLQPKWVGSLEGIGSDCRIQPFPNGERIFVHQRHRTFSVHDARTGVPWITPSHFDDWSGPHFLSADRLAFINWTGQYSVEDSQPWIGRQTEIILFSGDKNGVSERRFPMPGHSVRFGDETARGLLVGLLSTEANANIETIEPGLPYWSLYELDLKSGEIVPRLQATAPLGHWIRRVDPGAESLLNAGKGAVIGWNPQTGKIRPILPAITN